MRFLHTRLRLPRHRPPRDRVASPTPCRAPAHAGRGASRAARCPARATPSARARDRCSCSTTPRSSRPRAAYVGVRVRKLAHGRLRALRRRHRSRRSDASAPAALFEPFYQVDGSPTRAHGGSASVSPSRGASRAGSAATCVSSPPRQGAHRGRVPPRRGVLPHGGASARPIVSSLDATRLTGVTTRCHLPRLERDDASAPRGARGDGEAARSPGRTPRAARRRPRGAAVVEDAREAIARPGRRCPRATSSSPRAAPRPTTSVSTGRSWDAAARSSRADSSIPRSPRRRAARSREASP